MQPQCLLDGRFELGHRPQGLIADLLAVGVEGVEFLGDPGHGVGVAEEFDEGPRRCSRRRVMAGEHHRDEHAGHHIGRELGTAVFVTDGHEDVEEVAVLVGGGRSAAPGGP